MTSTPAPPLTVAQPGAGAHGNLGSIGVVFKLWGRDRELAEMGASGPPQPADVAALASRYGLQFGQPDWLPELISRYNLTPPPGS